MNKSITKQNEFNIHIENIRLHIHTENHVDSVYEISEIHFSHRHIFAEIFICGNDSITITVGEDEMTLNAWDVLIIPPGVMHHLCAKGNTAKWFVVDFLCEPISVYDSEDLYSRLSMLYGAKDVILIHNKHRFYDMTENILCASPDSDSVVSAMRFAELLLSLSGEYEKLCSKNEDASDFHKNNSLSTSKKLDMLINANFYKENAQEIISECMFISSRQLDRISKKHYGMTLHQIINENRVIAAEKMLKKSNLSVEKIASQVGFSSRSVFYRAFEAKFGCSPTEYRKSK